MPTQRQPLPPPPPQRPKPTVMLKARVIKKLKQQSGLLDEEVERLADEITQGQSEESLNRFSSDQIESLAEQLLEKYSSRLRSTIGMVVVMDELPKGQQEVDKYYAALFNACHATFEGQGALLTEGSDKLLESCIKYWYEDPPILKTGTVKGEHLVSILTETLNDPHISPRGGPKRKVDFFNLLYSFGQAGKTVLGDFVRKGLFAPR